MIVATPSSAALAVRPSLHPLFGALRRGRWFRGLPQELQDEIVRRSVQRSYRRDQMIVHQGSPLGGLFFVLDGQVALTRWLSPDEEILVHVADPGACFGESVLTHAGADLSATARSATDLLLLPRLELDRMLSAQPAMSRRFLELLSDRASLFVQMAAENRSLSPEARVRHRLATLAERRRRDDEETVELSLSQSDLAQLVGLSRQTTNALLQQLAQQGLVELAFRRLTIPDVEALRDLPEQDEARAV